MNFRPRDKDEPEINLIPFIDVLLVILIFLMLTTTYSKFTQMQITLPVADAEAQRSQPSEVIVSISSDGAYMVNKTLVQGRRIEDLANALTIASSGNFETMLIINADANARHQAVVSAMEAARRVGLSRITFATQSASRSNARP